MGEGIFGNFSLDKKKSKFKKILPRAVRTTFPYSFPRFAIAFVFFFSNTKINFKYPFETMAQDFSCQFTQKFVIFSIILKPSRSSVLIYFREPVPFEKYEIIRFKTKCPKIIEKKKL